MMQRVHFPWRSLCVLSLLTWASPAVGQSPDENPTPNLSHQRHKHHHNHPHETETPTADRFFTTRASDVVLPLPGEEDAFVFGVFGDRTGGPPEGVDVLADAVRDVNLIEPDLVMTVGDLVNGYNRTDEWLVQMREFKSIMGELLCPWFPVAGNHDVYWRPLDDPRMPESQHEKSYEMHFGPLWYSFQHKHCNFIVLYSDEGDPETGEKNFNNPEAQKVSQEQLEFLKEALKRGAEDDHQFLFLHHPRWLAERYGSDWHERVHPLLKETGNVTAVFAGHIHYMRYDPEDGIEYVTLATVGGGQSSQVPEAGFLHQYHLVTVRPDQVAMAAFPVGEAMNVREITSELQQEAIELANQPLELSRPIRIDDEGPEATTVTATVRNPASKPIDFTLTPTSADSRWIIAPDHTHGHLDAGEQQAVEFRIDYLGESLDEAFRELDFVLAQDYLTKTTRYSIPESRTPVEFELDITPPDRSATNKSLALDGQDDTLAIAAEDLQLPQGRFTLECWVRAESYRDRAGLLAKTQNSEFSIFANDGQLSGSVHLDGAYRRVEADGRMPLRRWVHVALVHDNSAVRLYVDGRMVDQQEVDPDWQRTTNELPFYIGADPRGDGTPMSFFHGQVDEVRLTAAVLYEDDFAPDRRLAASDQTIVLYNFDRTLGPFHLDAGPHGLHTTARGGASLTEVGR